VARASGRHAARCEFLQPSLLQRGRTCTTCRRIDHVIDRLKQLAFQEPWRLNDGPELQEWEKEGITIKGQMSFRGRGGPGGAAA
jgi:hypothetical protein